MKKEIWFLEDIEALAKEYPYTYYKPSLDLIKTIKMGDLVKVTVAYEEAVASERMWVEVTGVKEDLSFTGTLQNEPSSSTVLKFGETMAFKVKHISDIYEKSEESIVDEYHDRCITTVRILNGEDTINYIYFEEPNTIENVDNYINTGVTILSGDESDEYVNNVDNLRLVSLGAVLNRDDSFISLLTPDNIGKSFERSSAGTFEEVK